MFSRYEIFAGILATAAVIVMGIIVFTGPYHKINKPALASNLPVQHVTIVTDPKTVGRYTPKSITIRVGQAINFKNDSNAVHTVTATNNSFNSGDITTGGGTWHFVATKPGKFQYYCYYHPYMHGTVVVKS